MKILPFQRWSFDTRCGIYEHWYHWSFSGKRNEDFLWGNQIVLPLYTLYKPFIQVLRNFYYFFVHVWSWGQLYIELIVLYIYIFNKYTWLLKVLYEWRLLWIKLLLFYVNYIFWLNLFTIVFVFFLIKFLKLFLLSTHFAFPIPW